MNICKKKKILAIILTILIVSLSTISAFASANYVPFDSNQQPSWFPNHVYYVGNGNVYGICFRGQPYLVDNGGTMTLSVPNNDGFKLYTYTSGGWSYLSGATSNKTMRYTFENLEILDSDKVILKEGTDEPFFQMGEATTPLVTTETMMITLSGIKSLVVSVVFLMVLVLSFRKAFQVLVQLLRG